MPSIQRSSYIIFFSFHFILTQSLAQTSSFHKGVLALQQDCKIFHFGKDTGKTFYTLHRKAPTYTGKS